MGTHEKALSCTAMLRICKVCGAKFRNWAALCGHGRYCSPPINCSGGSHRQSATTSHGGGGVRLELKALAIQTIESGPNDHTKPATADNNLPRLRQPNAVRENSHQNSTVNDDMLCCRVEVEVLSCSCHHMPHRKTYHAFLDTLACTSSVHRCSDDFLSSPIHVYKHVLLACATVQYLACCCTCNNLSCMSRHNNHNANSFFFTSLQSDHVCDLHLCEGIWR